MNPPHIARQCAPPNMPARNAAINPEIGMKSAHAPVQEGALGRIDCSTPAIRFRLPAIASSIQDRSRLL